MSSQSQANSEPSERRGIPPFKPAGEPGTAARPAPFGQWPGARGPAARILVAEDDAFVRAGIVGLLEEQAGLECCAEVDSIVTAARAAVQSRPDLLLLDLQLADGETLGLIHTLRIQFPALAILVVSHHDETLYAQKALQAGARGYLMKEAAPEHLLSAIRTVLEGRTYLSPAMHQRLCPTPGLGWAWPPPMP